MLIIKLDAIDSTNSYLRKLLQNQELKDYTVVITNKQTHGRGQMGTSWTSQEGKNLITSIYKDVSNIKLHQQFFISIVTSLAIVKALKQFQLPKLSIKWPNDILSDNKKICGILIENVIKQDAISATLIGVGLNVNQTKFDNLPNASSLQLITGTHFSIEEVLHTILENLKNYFSLLKAQKLEALKAEYESLLFRKNKPSTFEDAEGNLFSGFIKSINDSGNLCVLLEDEIIKEFDLKELKLLY